MGTLEGLVVVRPQKTIEGLKVNEGLVEDPLQFGSQQSWPRPSSEVVVRVAVLPCSGIFRRPSKRFAV